MKVSTPGVNSLPPATKKTVMEGGSVTESGKKRGRPSKAEVINKVNATVAKKLILVLIPK